MTCNECCPNPYQREAAQALAESGLLSGVSDSYRAGFVDGFGDHMGAQDRREWAAGFQHGYDAAHRRTEPADEPLRQPATDIWDEPLPGMEDGLAPVLDRSDLPSTPPSDAAMPLRNVPTPAMPPSGPRVRDLPPDGPMRMEQAPPRQPNLAPPTGPSTGPSTILDGPSSGASPTRPPSMPPATTPPDTTPFAPPTAQPAPSETLPATPPEAAPMDDLRFDEPPPSQSPPQTPSEPADSDYDFDDLFADPDADSTGARPSPRGQQRGMAGTSPAGANAPKFSIRFKDDDKPTSSARRGNPAKPVSFEAPAQQRGTRHAPSNHPAPPTQNSPPFSQLFHTPPISSAARLKNASPTEAPVYKSRFTVDQDQAVILKDD
ncbi:MAG: hypothetical protein AAGF97_00285 [Planctomycetota bacterium]